MLESVAMRRADVEGGARKVPGPAHAVVAIALNTFREAIRDRVLYLLVVFALIVIGVSRALSMLTVGDEDKIIKDVGLGAISLFGVMVAGFVGVSLVFKEIEKRTVYTLLANPVRRWQFIVGKYAGLLCVLAVNLVLMSAALFVVLALRSVAPWDLIPAIALIYVELMVVTAFALFFSSLTNPILAALWTFCAYFAGHLSWSLKLLRERAVGDAAKALCDAIYFILPKFDQLNIKREAVHGLALADGHVALAAVNGLAYAAVVLILACLVFARKEFS